MTKLLTFLLALHFILMPVALAQGTGEIYRETPTSQNGGSTFYMNQILSLSTGAIGSNILISCKLGASQPSLYIFLAGSLAYIGSEVLGGKSQNDFHNKKANDLKMAEVKMKEGGDLQKSILEAAKSEEEGNLEFIKKRKIWMTAVTAVYTAAAAMAVVEKILSQPPPLGTSKPSNAACTSGPDIGKFVKLALVSAYTYGTSKTAGSGVVSQYGGMALALGSTIPAMAKAIHTTYSDAIPRAITFGASAVLATGVTVGLAKKQKIAEDNIAKMQKVLDSFTTATTPTNSLGEGTLAGSGGATSSDKTYSVTMLPDVAQPKSCWSQDSNSMNYSEGSCKNSFQLSKQKFDFNLSIPSLNAAGNLALDMAQAAANGDMGKASIAAGSLAAQAARLKEIKDSLQNKYNDQLKSQGEKPFNFDKEVAQTVASMTETAQSAALSSGLDLASMEDDFSDDEILNDTSKSKVAAIPAMPGKSSESQFDFSDVDSSSASEGSGSPQAAASLGDSLDRYESTEEDISKKSEVSIFKQLSHRYLLNYTRIFETKKTLEASPAEK